jgi:hypothetical protein
MKILSATATAVTLLFASSGFADELDPAVAGRISSALEVVVNISDRGGLSTEPTEAECTAATSSLDDIEAASSTGVTYQTAGNLHLLAKYAAPICGRYAEAIEKFGLRFLIEQTLSTPSRDGTSLARLIDDAIDTDWTSWKPDPAGS